MYPNLYSATTDEIKAAIMTYGAVDAAVNVTSAFSGYSGGVFEDTADYPNWQPYYYSTTNHAIALIGWDDSPPEGGGGAWILRNSWGSWWGEGGYMRIRYHSSHVNTSAAFLVYQSRLAAVDVLSVDNITAQDGRVNGTIATKGYATTYWVEYGPTDSYGQSSATSSIAAGGGDTPVSVNLAGLPSRMTQHFRLVAENSYGTKFGPDMTFATIGNTALPMIQDASVSTRDQSSARITAKINPRGPITSWWVEYQKDGASMQTSPVYSIPAGTAFKNIELTIPGLTSGAHYTWRVSASNSAGLTTGSSNEFTTPTNVFQEGFNGTVPPSGWSKQIVKSNGSPAPDWTAATSAVFGGSEPGTAPEEGAGMAKFNSYDTAVGNEARLITPILNLSTIHNSKVSFRLYHDMRYTFPDYVRIQASVDGSTWINMAESCERYTGARGWSDCEADLSYFDGRQLVYVAILGHSEYGSDTFIDNLYVTGTQNAATPTPTQVPTIAPTIAPTIPVVIATPLPTLIPALEPTPAPSKSGPALKLVSGKLTATVPNPMIPLPVTSGRSVKYEFLVEKKSGSRWVTVTKMTRTAPSLTLKGVKKGTYRVKYRSLVYKSKVLLKASSYSRVSKVKAG